MNGETDNRPRPKQEKVRPSYLWFLAGTGGVLIALFVLSLQWKDSRRVARVEVEGASIFTGDDVRAMAAVPHGVLLDTVSLMAVRARLVSNPYIRNASVSRAYPDAVSIEIDERVPVANFSLKGAIRYIDADGVVLPYMESGVPHDLPGIAGIPGLSEARIGEAVESEQYFEALSVLEAALETDSSVYRLISEVDMKDGDDVTIYSSEYAVPIIVGHGDVKRKLLMLREFWDKFVIDEGPEHLEYLDLRFADRVVAKWINKSRKEG